MNSICDDIAVQLLTGEIGKNFDVILGGGHREFIPKIHTDPHGRVGLRNDSRDLVREWMFSHRRPMTVHDRVKQTCHYG